MRSLALLLLLSPLGLKGGGSPARPASLRGFQIHAIYYTFRELWEDLKTTCTALEDSIAWEALQPQPSRLPSQNAVSRQASLKPAALLQRPMLTMLAEWARCVAQEGQPVLCPLQDSSELRHIGREDDWPFLMLSLLRFLVMMHLKGLNSKTDAESPFVTIVHLSGHRLRKHAWPSTERHMFASW